MNQHQQIIEEFTREYEALKDAEIVGPGALAVGIYKRFASGEVHPNIHYGCLEHFKQMARKFLARRHNADSDDNPAHRAQGAFGFSGQLQDRYPLPRKASAEPVYKLRSLLTDEERAWNVAQLRKSADARMEHADALEAEGRPLAGEAA